MAWDEAWETVFRAQEWGRYPAEDLVRFVARNFYRVPDRGAVQLLEVGCGPGGNLWYMAREGFTVAGIDGSSTAVELAKNRLDAEVPGWRGEIVCGDMTTLPFADGRFDGVVDSEAIYCNSFGDSKRIYNEVRRVLKPGGALFSRTFAAGSHGDGTGDQIGRSYWRTAEGPATGKGLCRFTSRDDISELLDGFSIEALGLLSRSARGSDDHAVKEWLITARRL